MDDVVVYLEILRFCDLESIVLTKEPSEAPLAGRSSMAIAMVH